MINNVYQEGDLTQGRNITAGGDITARGNSNVDGNLKVKGWVDAPNIKGSDKGLFKSEEALNAEYPKPQNGWLARVGNSLPANLYRGEDGKWVATGGTSGDGNVYIPDIPDISKLETKIENVENDVLRLKRDKVTVDQSLSKASKNAISNKAVATALEGVVEKVPTVDQSLNEASANAISNKAVTTALKRVRVNDIDPTIVVTGTNVRLTGDGSSALITIKATFNGKLISAFNSLSDGVITTEPDSLTFDNPKIAWGDLKPYIKEETKILSSGILQIKVTQTDDLPEGDKYKIADTKLNLAFHNRVYSHPIFASIDETMGGNGDDPSTYYKRPSVLTFENFFSGVNVRSNSTLEAGGEFVFLNDRNQFAYHAPSGGYWVNGITAEGFSEASYCEGGDNKPRKNVIFVCKADNCAYISFDGNTLTKIKM